MDRIRLEPVAFRRVPDPSQPGLPMVLIEFASGHTAAILHRSQKLNFVRMGLVFLGADFENLVPPIFLAGDPDEGRGDHTFTGFSQNPVIAAAVQELFREDLQRMEEFERAALECGDARAFEMNESAIPEEVLAILQARGWNPADGYKKNDGGQAAVVEVRHPQKGRGAFRLLKRTNEVDVQRFAREESPRGAGRSTGT